MGHGPPRGWEPGDSETVSSAVVNIKVRESAVGCPTHRMFSAGDVVTEHERPGRGVWPIRPDEQLQFMGEKPSAKPLTRDLGDIRTFGECTKRAGGGGLRSPHRAGHRGPGLHSLAMVILPTGTSCPSCLHMTVEALERTRRIR